MAIETVYLLLLLMAGVGAFGSYVYGNHKYERGVIDAIHMHNEGRLTYESYMEDGVEMIDIRIEPYED